jgi:hypothetical protein
MFDVKSRQVKEAFRDAVIWEQCFKEEICVNIPFDGKKCLTAEACIRILENNGEYFIELQAFGNKVRYKLASTCFPVYTIGIASLQVCASVKTNEICLVVKLCIGGKIDGIDLEKCWKVYEGCIAFVRVADLKSGAGRSAQLDDAGLIHSAVNAGASHVFIERAEQPAEAIGSDFDMERAIGRY